MWLLALGLRLPHGSFPNLVQSPRSGHHIAELAVVPPIQNPDANSNA